MVLWRSQKPETINYRTLKPEREGLFDEVIFGPTKRLGNVLVVNTNAFVTEGLFVTVVVLK